ncbi:acetoin utilization deacetylase AcuC-like enzyme [Rhodobium orientis]|uniref:Acetylpolyamine amidohydrolase n=1 Tax=Rhodobium orientis TaxID=34017 RepID=A0A327JKX4_9HYPH|nr:histone deacetylase family protein [Rhodobium orientis]MBB4304743.1 acetoin utilization deacetylase AcuC-like enzyme [Rhodobium orientis]MBK5952053.1 acetylpolyamine amidohydrolase [Rhodobium orientis]RAI26545.1 acetylpolyamine amidohydrolase [Rhodobium orientis]
MKAFFHDQQRRHDPKHFLSSGAPQPNPEVPGRIDALLAGLAEAKVATDAPADRGFGPIAAIHSPEYLVFLQNIYARWQRIPGASAEVVPNIHPDRRDVGYPKSAVGQAGFHMADTACPISENTWESAYWSAQTAVAAADHVASGAGDAYALCRPPGHHAFADLAGGFCFLNNTSIAAERLLTAGHRPAIVDVDLHHGNGTQGIFYTRSDVLTVSIHADPARYYPFFWGHADERGTGAGLGTNLNLPIPRGSKDESFLAALDTGLSRVRAFGADVLVVALGLDAFEGDPFGGLAVTTAGFARIADALAGLKLPTVIVQEGGYLCPELGPNLTSFLTGFGAERAS